MVPTLCHISRDLKKDATFLPKAAPNSLLNQSYFKIIQNVAK